MIIRDIIFVLDLVNGGIRINSVGDIVCVVDERGGGGSYDLEESVEKFGMVVEVSGMRVNFFDVIINDGFFFLGRNNVVVNFMEKSLFEVLL